MNDKPLVEIPIGRGLGIFAVAGVTAVQVVTTMAMSLPAAIAPKLAEALDVPVAMVGLNISVAYVGATLMSLAAGLVTRRMGSIRTNQIATVLLVLSLVCISVPHLAGLAIGSFGIGMAQGITNPAAAHLMIRIASPANRNLIFSIKQTGQPLGGILAGLMAPPVAVVFGWQAALLTGAVLAFSMLITIQPLRARLDGDRDPETKFRGAVFKDVGLVLRNRNLRLLGLSALTQASIQLALMTYVVTMLVEDVGLDLVTAGTGLAVLQVAGVTGRLGWGFVADRFKDGLGVLLTTQIVSTLSALATAFFLAEAPLPVIYAILFVYGSTAIGWNGVFMAEIARMAPPGRTSSATGGVLVPTFIGVIMGPLAFVAVHGLIGSYTATFGVMALITVAGMIPVLMLRLPGRQG